MTITGIHFNYYQVCQRKLWLFANGINMEQTSDLVNDGKLIHETSYPQRSERYEEVEIDGIKIDYYDARNKVIHEIKRSDKVEEAHIWQVKYYIYVLERNGIDGVTGILEYPELRQTTKVELTDADRQKIKEIEEKIAQLISADNCPPVINAKICKSCSYYDFCYVKEENF
ncbi:MAG TPA: CRISPR-associated protein Cas4 [bacterium]|nr:CRISPR-associated protein Cas4 [bacterium]